MDEFHHLAFTLQMLKFEGSTEAFDQKGIEATPQRAATDVAERLGRHFAVEHKKTASSILGS